VRLMAEAARIFWAGLGGGTVGEVGGQEVCEDGQQLGLGEVVVELPFEGEGVQGSYLGDFGSQRSLIQHK